jgi:hypothetical protein
MKRLVLFFSALALWLHSIGQQKGNETPPFLGIVISEIMADPDPPVSLPNAEYIEFFNRGAHGYELAGCTLAIGKYNKKLDSVILMPGEYLIVCDSMYYPHFKSYGKTLPLAVMPALNNNGQTITLSAADGNVIHSVTYSPGWYRTGETSTGGWSLEIIDPDNPCSGASNWRSSKDPLGGTPGRLNSVDDDNPDVQSPLLLRATMPDPASVMLHFSEPMDPGQLSSDELYSVNNGLLQPKTVLPAYPLFNSVTLHYPLPFQQGTTYTVTVMNTVKDCAGNTLASPAFVPFALAVPPAVNDLVINEILFDTPPGIAEFIECCNASDKVLDLSAFYLCLSDRLTGKVKEQVHFRNTPCLIFPDETIVVTRSVNQLPAISKKANRANLIEHPDLFPLPNGGSVIALTDTLGNVIDEAYYSPDMHNPLLSNTKGVSLEKINPLLPANENNSWQSSAASAGYSTPGLPNSQLTDPLGSFEVSVNPGFFSPDNDGVDDLAVIHVQTSNPGWIATITIYNTTGKCIRDLAVNTLLGTDEQFTWDGTYTNGNPAETGLYIINVNMFSPLGATKNFRKVIPLVRK